MANVDKPAGSFCWVELATTDQSAAKAFYTSLFGWTVTDYPMGASGAYSMFRLHERDAAAGYTLGKDQLARGTPVHWSLYIAVDNADEATKKATQAGATIIMPPSDVMNAGRMAVIHDPTGAVFSVWEAKDNQGIGVSGENGSLCWADLSTGDPASGAKFYSTLFGWEITRAPNDPSGYLHIKNGEHFIGGIPPAEHRDPQWGSHWLIYFLVADVAATAAKAAQLGARTLMPAQDMAGVGTWAILADPQGAVFAIFKSAR
ncbi:MAG TPA: VOC family protein [Terriglobales bacterium]